MFNDLRFAIRQILKNPGFSLIAILSLALGIGAPTAVFTIINGTLFGFMPYSHPEQLVLVTPEKIAGGATNATLGGQQFEEWSRQNQSFAGIAAYDWTFNFLIHPDGNESVEGMIGSAALFHVLEVHALLGRTFTDEEKSVEQAPVVLIGYDLWQRRFGGDPAIIGKTINLSRLPPLTVVGVMTPGLRFLPARGEAQAPNYNVHALVDYWLPGTPMPTRGGRWNVVARLKPDVTLPQANTDLARLAAVQAQSNPGLAGLTAVVTPISRALDGDIRRIVLPLFGAVCLVLFIAGANVTSLLLVRGLNRQKELAIRTALGARWPQLLRLTLTESLLLAVIGGAIGILLAFATTKILLWAAPNSIPRLDAISIDLRVLGFAVGVSLMTGLSSGVLAAWQVLRPDVNQALKAGGAAGKQGRAGHRLLGGLVAGEVALTFILLIGAGLMLKTMARFTRLNPGYETHQIVTMVVTSLAPNVMEFHRTALQNISALPGVTSAAFVWGLPLTGNFWRVPLYIAGRPPAINPQDRSFVPLRAVTPGYFKLMGIALKEGRLFSDRDQMGSVAVAIINEELARRYFPQENPLGKSVSFTAGKPLEIVGVVGDLRDRALNAPLDAEIYLPFFQSPAFSKHLVLRTEIEPMSVVAAVQNELRRIDPGVVIEKVKTMDQIRADSISAQHFAMVLILGFSLVALVLAVVGVYGVISHSVLQRSHEIGVRMAIGAQSRDILRLILGHGLALALAGIALGLAGAIAFTRVLQGLLFEVDPIDPFIFAAVPLLLVVVTFLACWWPARRATKIDPLVVLRSE